ncbi:uncharacterized protein EHS24_007863 [Apiotrichum porosum]|uniref:Uncharacterized protein n=1 Tax=Apiotrichum porosum TaxID=105984 RepID=A0A427XS72_9TREE|nr:uncharacterized protein EHS24_007863 [Apiotrichum porosum]RSH81680.1 hypothetical protein EHS24_007863 [Apiotrichum porosum]
MSPKPEAPPPRTCTGHPVTGSKAADGLCNPYYYPILRITACSYCQKDYSEVTA